MSDGSDVIFCLSSVGVNRLNVFKVRRESTKDTDSKLILFEPRER